MMAHRKSVDSSEDAPQSGGQSLADDRLDAAALRLAVIIDQPYKPDAMPEHVAQFCTDLTAHGVLRENIYLRTVGRAAEVPLVMGTSQPPSRIFSWLYLRYFIFLGVFRLEQFLLRRRRKYRNYGRLLAGLSVAFAGDADASAEVAPSGYAIFDLRQDRRPVDVTVWMSVRDPATALGITVSGTESRTEPGAQTSTHTSTQTRTQTRTTYDPEAVANWGKMVQPVYGARRPYGFYEAWHKAPKIDFSIVQYDFGNGLMPRRHFVFDGAVMTANRWLVSHANLIAKLSAHMAVWIVRGAHPRAMRLDPSWPAWHEADGEAGNHTHDRSGDHADEVPTCGDSLRYLAWAFLGYPLTKFMTKQLRRRAPRWSVSFYAGDGFHTPHRVGTTIPNPAGGRFFADPFAIQHQGQSFCFVEDFFPDEKKGKISALSLTADGSAFLGVVLDEPFHLSFPYMINHQGEIYMLPESAAAGEIRLYRAHDFPNDWRLEQVLMRDVDAADTIVFQKGSRWYMLTNICTAGRADHQSELHLFSATDLLSTEWTPCPHNPIIFDPLRARNAGFFIRDGEFYRVNQVQARGQYGYAFQINHITQITPDHYAERAVICVEPDLAAGMARTHHFHIGSTHTVRDHAYWQKR